MKMIFAVDNNWAIGNKGKLLFQIPEDLKRFKKLTENNIVIMGRKTLESLPGGNPLNNRINIVLTENKKYKKENVIVVNSIDKLLELLECINGEKNREEFIIGGGEIVNQLIHRCNEAYITKVFKDIEEIDTKIPNLDKTGEWEIMEKSKEKSYKELNYKYIRYRRI